MDVTSEIVETVLRNETLEINSSILRGNPDERALMLTTWLTDWLTDWLTPWSWTLPEKLSGPQLIKKFPICYETLRFITALTKTRQPSMLSHSTSWRFILILSFHLRLSLPKWSPSLGLPHQNPVCTCFIPYTCYMRCLPYSSWFEHRNDIWWEVQSVQILVM